MAVSLVKSGGECKTLSREEILATLATCQCGEIYEQYMLCKDGQIRKRGVCPDCQRKILDNARTKRGPGAPRMTAAKRARIAAEREKLAAENLSLRERLDKAKAEAEEAAERGVERPPEYFPPARAAKPVEVIAQEPVVPAPVLEPPPSAQPKPAAPAIRQSVEGVVTLDLRPYQTLVEELKLLALEDVRSIEQEAIWILMDYVKTVWAISRDVLDRAKEDRYKPKGTRECRYRD